MISAHDIQFYETNGYLVVRDLFSREEVDALRDHYMGLREKGPQPGDTCAIDLEASDPLLRYPRMVHMHYWDAASMRWMLDDRLVNAMTAMLGDEPLAVQTMMYFKPPGSRGQALHQDNFFLRARPGTCMAAWMAMDACDEENGCMQVVPGSQGWPVLCPDEADTSLSFTGMTVPLPEGFEPVTVPMMPGDVLFFNGSIVHGSPPNRSADRFRRSLIAHFIGSNTRQLSSFYERVFSTDGAEVSVGKAPDGGPCGVFVEHDAAHPVMIPDGLEGHGELEPGD